MIKLTWLGLDFSPIVLDAPYETCRSETYLSDPIAKVTLANPNMIFSEGDARSILSDTIWQGTSMQIERDGETILHGIVTDAVVTRLDCTLDVQSRFSRAFRSYCNAGTF